MAKDCRTTVRMSEELAQWVHEQASSREMDDAAYIRMVLAETRSGVAATRIKAETPVVVATPAPIQRDMLQVASNSDDHNVDVNDMIDEPQTVAAPIDVDALVAGAFEDAEAAGLTEPAIMDEGEMPDSGVRPLIRRPIPFSRGTQHQRLEQLFGNG